MLLSYYFMRNVSKRKYCHELDHTYWHPKQNIFVKDVVTRVIFTIQRKIRATTTRIVSKIKLRSEAWYFSNMYTSLTESLTYLSKSSSTSTAQKTTHDSENCK